MADSREERLRKGMTTVLRTLPV